MRRSVSIAELGVMSAAQQRRRVGELVRAARTPANGELAKLDAVIREYEDQHKLDTATLRRELAEGRRQETEDICHWLMLVGLREHLAKRSTSAK
jgi:hypothetical protein